MFKAMHCEKETLQGVKQFHSLHYRSNMKNLIVSCWSVVAMEIIQVLSLKTEKTHLFFTSSFGMAIYSRMVK